MNGKVIDATGDREN